MTLQVPLYQQTAKQIAKNLDPFQWIMKDVNQKARELDNHLNGRHEFKVTLTSAIHLKPLTNNQLAMINNPYIPLKEMPFLYNVDTQRTESLLGVFTAILKSAMANKDNNIEEVPGFQDINGSDVVLEADSATNSFQIDDVIGDEDVGVVVGSGTTTVVISDNKLEIPIVNGTSSGQLQYGSTQISAMLMVPPEASFRISRSMGNPTGSTITVEEIGLIMKCNDTSGTKRNFLIERTLKNTDILDGENLLEVYSFQITT